MNGDHWPRQSIFMYFVFSTPEKWVLLRKKLAAKTTLVLLLSAHQPRCGDHIGGEHSRWPSPKEARHHESQGATWVGTKGQVARRPSSHGGWFPDETWRPQKELRGIAYNYKWVKLSEKCLTWGYTLPQPPCSFFFFFFLLHIIIIVIIIWVKKINSSNAVICTGWGTW